MPPPVRHRLDQPQARRHRRVSTQGARAGGRKLRLKPSTNLASLAPNPRQFKRGSCGFRRLTAVLRGWTPAAANRPNAAQPCGKRLRKAKNPGAGKRRDFSAGGISRPVHSTALPPFRARHMGRLVDPPAASGRARASSSGSLTGGRGRAGARPRGSVAHPGSGARLARRALGRRQRRSSRRGPALPDPPA